MPLDRGLAPSEAVSGKVATAQSTFAHAGGALDLPDAGFQADAGDMLPALVAVEVVHLGLKFI